MPTTNAPAIVTRPIRAGPGDTAGSGPSEAGLAGVGEVPVGMEGLRGLNGSRFAGSLQGVDGKGGNYVSPATLERLSNDRSTIAPGQANRRVCPGGGHNLAALANFRYSCSSPTFTLSGAAHAVPANDSRPPAVRAAARR